MAHFPTPILIVSASTNRGELFKTYEALSAGAVDVLDKPSGEASDAVWEDKLLASIKLVSRIRVITHPRARLAGYGQSPPVSVAKKMLAPETAQDKQCRVVAIGASTGGPAAIVEILRALPPSFQIPILLVIHIGEPFGEAFADWLDGQTQRRVSYAQEGTQVSALHGRVAMAPPNSHLEVKNGRLHLSKTPERHSCRPSVDVLFESLAIEYGAAVTACLLTGMGRDGASGLLAIKNSGGITVAQDEASCVVYGMPREAMLLGAVGRSLPLRDIGPALNDLPGANAGSAS